MQNGCPLASYTVRNGRGKHLAPVGARRLVVQEDVGAVLSVVVGHLQCGTDDKLVSATHAHNMHEVEKKVKQTL